MDREQTEKLILRTIRKLIYMMKKTESRKLFSILEAEYELLSELAMELDIDIPDIDDYTYKEITINPKIKETYYELNDIENNEFIINLLDLPEIIRKKIPLYYEKADFLRTKYSIKDSLKISKEFLLEFDSELYQVLTKGFSNNTILSLDNSFDNYYFGVTYTINSLNRQFVIINNVDSLDTTLTIVHETGHIYDDRFKNNNIEETVYNRIYSNFCEVYPIFIERVATDYLYKTKRITEREYIIKKRYYMQTMMENINNLITCLNAMDYNFYSASLTYAIGGLISLEYYDMYLEDKDKTIYNIKNMLKDQNNKSMEELLNSNGLDIERIMTFDTVIKHGKEDFKNKVLKKI